MTNQNDKTAKTDHPVHPLIAARWSPYVYDGRPVEKEKLQSCLEAARWAASSYNEQPWRFIIACKPDAAFDVALGCLVEANQGWAKNAGALLFTVVATTFSRNGKENRVAEHDIGLAMGNFALQATELGLHVHEMGGIDIEKVRSTYNIPAGFEPHTGLAIGYQGGNIADESLHERDAGPRNRKPLKEIVFEGGWGKPSSLA